MVRACAVSGLVVLQQKEFVFKQTGYIQYDTLLNCCSIDNSFFVEASIVSICINVFDDDFLFQIHVQYRGDSSFVDVRYAPLPEADMKTQTAGSSIDKRRCSQILGENYMNKHK